VFWAIEKASGLAIVDSRLVARKSDGRAKAK